MKNMNMKILAILVFNLFLELLSDNSAKVLSAQTTNSSHNNKVYVEINRGSKQAFPIAITEFKNFGTTLDSQSISNQIYENITSNLKLTSVFRLIDRKSFIENTSKSGISIGEFDFANWKQIDALALIKGSFEIQGTVLSVQFRLYDVLASTQIGGKSYKGTTKDILRISNQISNEILSILTGNNGFFGTKISAVSNASGVKEIVVMDANGQKIIPISNNKSINLLPSWSPSGDKIAYTSYKAGNPDIYVADLAKGVTKKLIYFTGLNSGATWSPSGDIFAVTLSKDGDPEIYLVDNYGKEQARLTRSYGVDSSPSFSPDGRQIVFVSARSGGAHLYIMNRDGSGTRRLTFSGSQNVSPSWSPKGDKIAFSSLEQGRFDIFTISTDGSNLTRITQDQGNNEDPCWSPDGNYILFSSNRGKIGSQLYISTIDGQSQVRVTSGPGNFTNPSWSPSVDW